MLFLGSNIQEHDLLSTIDIESVHSEANSLYFSIHWYAIRWYAIVSGPSVYSEQVDHESFKNEDFHIRALSSIEFLDMMILKVFEKLKCFLLFITVHRNYEISGVKPKVANKLPVIVHIDDLNMYNLQILHMRYSL